MAGRRPFVSIYARITNYVKANKQSFINIFGSFIVFSMAGQVYAAKVEKLQTVDQVATRDKALLKMEALVRRPDATATWQQDLTRLIAEARGEQARLVAEEVAREFAAEAAFVTASAPAPPKQLI
jgi:hypothetical protein